MPGVVVKRYSSIVAVIAQGINLRPINFPYRKNLPVLGSSRVLKFSSRILLVSTSASSICSSIGKRIKQGK